MEMLTSPPPAPGSSWLRAGLGFGRLQPPILRTPRHRSCTRHQPRKKAGVGREEKQELAFYVLPSHLLQASLGNHLMPALLLQNKGRVVSAQHEPMPSRARFYTSTSTPCHQHLPHGQSLRATAWRCRRSRTCLRLVQDINFTPAPPHAPPAAGGLLLAFGVSGKSPRGVRPLGAGGTARPQTLPGFPPPVCSDPATGEPSRKRGCVIPRAEEFCPQPALSDTESQGCRTLLLQISVFGDLSEAGSS